MKLLIVEDEEVLARVLKEKFERENFEVDVASDGEEAMTNISKFVPDVVLLDLILPKKHGLEVLADLKADEEFKKIPVIVLTNLDTDEDIKKALALGADDYFVKVQHPIDEVVEKVKLLSIKSRTKKA
ncbi:response regulator [Candidatus Uhrbacteria bacterium]|nr:response regulator [Candidatus Uhrbacteria bacterium]